MKDYYETLEVSRTASREVIEKAYRILAKKYHPDRQNKGVSDYRFKKIQEAYETLSNPEKRKQYDVKLRESEIEQENRISEQSSNKINSKQKNRFSNTSIEQIANSYTTGFKKIIYNEKNKNSSEKIKDLKALTITVIIMAVVIFICIKVPWIRKVLIK